MKKWSIAFWLWTEAELIKTFPVIIGLRNYPKVDSYIISTGQNNLLNSSISQKYNIIPSLIINQFYWIKKPIYIILWYIKTFFTSFFKIRKFIKQNNIKYIIVHWDTLSTLMGAIYWAILWIEVWHLEAGLRTFNWLKPFPEEIDRFIVWHLSTVHFCQNQQALDNVKTHKWDKIYTQWNVIYDVVDMFSMNKPEFLNNELDSYWVVTFHRAESLYIKKNFDLLIQTLFLSAIKTKTLFIMFDATKEVILQKKWLLEKIQSNKNIIIHPRLAYSDFCYLMRTAEYIITDWGSNQEELAHLWTPTLIMRENTERSDWLGKNVVLSYLQLSKVKVFLDDYTIYNFKGETQWEPTKIIIKYILNRLNNE